MTQQQETVTKQRNPLRIEQGKKLVEYNKHKKVELKRLNEQITKQDNIAEHKPRLDTSTYVYAGSLSVQSVVTFCIANLRNQNETELMLHLLQW